MKLSRIFPVFLLVFVFACQPAQQSDTPVVVTSISIYEDLIRNIAGDAVRVHTLITGAETPHTFDLTGSDARLLQEADLIVLNGLGLEGWAHQLAGSAPEDAWVFSAGDTLATRDTTFIGGNPHLWMDPRLTAKLVKLLVPPLQHTVPEAADSLGKRAERYTDQLLQIHSEITMKLEGVRGSKVIVQTPGVDLFLDAYGIRRVDAIVTSPGTEPSAKHMTALMDRIRSGEVDGIIHFPQFSKSIPRMLHDETGVPLILMSPLINAAPHVGSYIDLLWYNADQLYNGLAGVS